MMDNQNDISQQPSTQPTVEQPPAVSPKPSLHAKAFLITFALFILLFFTLTVLLLVSRTKPSSQPPPSRISSSLSQPFPTPDLTANNKWTITDNRQLNTKTFRSQTYGYEFQYPIAWEQDNSICAGPDISECLDQHEFVQLNSSERFEIFISKWKSHISLESLIAGNSYGPNVVDFDYLGMNTYNGIPMVLHVTKHPFQLGNGGPFEFLITSDFLNTEKNHHFDIELSWSASLDAKPSETEIIQHKNKLQQILSTFRFID